MAYAAISSLMHTLEKLLQPNPRLAWTNSTQLQQVQSAYQSLRALRVILEKATNETTDPETLNNVERRISDAVYKAEDKVDSCLSGIIEEDDKTKNPSILGRIFVLFETQRRRQARDSRLTRACEALDDVLQQVEITANTLQDELMHIEFKQHGSKSTESMESSSSRLRTVDLSIVVGMEDEIETILDRLTDQTDELTIIPIVGMGGIGKTTLARKVFDHSTVHHQFDTRAWVTISQQYNERHILLQVVSAVNRDTTESNQQLKNDQLAMMVKRGLMRRRFLIVIDDLWSKDAWDQLQILFPNDNNKSRILLTTRFNDIAEYASPNFSPYNMSFLSLDDSWSLFTERLFQQSPCPPQLEKIGKQIINQCRGLPLSIVVIAGLLGNMDLKLNNWKKVEENLNKVFDTVPEQRDAILSLSYNYLPQHLRACLLYVGGFPEDMEIGVSKLIRLWIAEQFVKPRDFERLELVGEEYLLELIDRSLILAGSRRANGRIKTVKIHDALRQLCIKKHVSDIHIFADGIIAYVWRVNGSFESRYKLRGYAARSFILRNASHSVLKEYLKYYSVELFKLVLCARDPVQGSLGFKFPPSMFFKFLKVLDVASLDYDFSLAIEQLVHLRYVAACIEQKVYFLAKLWNLQTISFRSKRGYSKLPLEIWTMSGLRHLELGWRINMPNPLKAEKRYFVGEQSLYLVNLQRLSLRSSANMVEILRRTPNLNKLKIKIATGREWSAFLDSLILLKGLESLSLSSFCRGRDDVLLYLRSQFSRRISFTQCREQLNLSGDIFLPSLKQLKLAHTCLPWEDMDVLARLPNLEVLKAKSAFKGTNWKLDEDAVFQKLKYLKIELENLKRWEAASGNFPILEKLVLIKLSKLEEIPQDIGEIMTLKSIQMVECSSGALASANRIQEYQQENLGNYELQVIIELGKQQTFPIEGCWPRL